MLFNRKTKNQNLTTNHEGAKAWKMSPELELYSAVVTAALCFDFLFIPPFYTFVIGSLEGWLVLVIFFAIAILVIGRIQDSLSKAREATFMYELSSALANARTQDAVAHIVARHIRQLFQASLVYVTFQQSKQAERVSASEPQARTNMRIGPITQFCRNASPSTFQLRKTSPSSS